MVINKLYIRKMKTKFLIITFSLIILISCKKNKVDTIDDVIGNYTYDSYTENGKTEIYNIKDYLIVTKDSIFIDKRGRYIYQVFIFDGELNILPTIPNSSSSAYIYNDGKLQKGVANYISVFRKQ